MIARLGAPLAGFLLYFTLILGDAVVAPAAVVEQRPADREQVHRPAVLGREEAALRQEYGAALKPQPIERRYSLDPGKGGLPNAAAKSKEVEGEEPPTEVRDPFAGQQRFMRKPVAGDVQSVEYELFRGRVYRVRWQLVERFERPLMASLVAHLTMKLGKPYYDQLIEGKFGTGRATLRRAGWRHGSLGLEVRQLNPQVGGSIFVTLSDQETIQDITESGGTAAPEPDSIGPWWQKPVKPFSQLTVSERDTLLIAFDEVLAEVGWEPERIDHVHH